MRNSKYTNSVALTALLLAAMLLVPAPQAGAKSHDDDNGRIAFLQGVNVQFVPGDIFTVNPDGSDEKQLTSFGTSGGVGNEAWSPDGQKLAFSFVPAVGSPAQLWEINADGSNLHLLLKDPSSYDTTPNFSPDGSHVVFARCQATCAIFRIQADGTGLKAVTHFNHNPDVIDFAPAYSPDGRTIAFNSFTRGGLLLAIYLMNTDGSNIRQLTPPELTTANSMWSPDGTKLVFYTNAGNIHDEEIWTIDTDGTHLTQLTNNNRNWNGYLTGSHDYSPSWSPRGDAIAFERDAPDFSTSAIYTINPDGTGLKVVRASHPRKAPQVAVHAPRGAMSQAVQRLLQLVETNAANPRWGPATE